MRKKENANRGNSPNATSMVMADNKKLGRPFGTPFKAFNFHCDADIYEWLQANKGEKPITRVINDILRKALENEIKQ